MGVYYKQRRTLKKIRNVYDYAVSCKGWPISVVLSGFLFGILIARVIDGIIAEFASWRVVYYFSLGAQSSNSCTGRKLFHASRLSVKEQGFDLLAYPMYSYGVF